MGVDNDIATMQTTGIAGDHLAHIAAKAVDGNQADQGQGDTENKNHRLPAAVYYFPQEKVKIHRFTGRRQSCRHAGGLSGRPERPDFDCASP